MKYRIEFELFENHWSVSTTARSNPVATIKAAEKEIKYALRKALPRRPMTYRIVNLETGAVRPKLYTKANTLRRKAKAATA